MRLTRWAALLAVLCLTPDAAHAQSRKAARAERKIAAVMTDLREEMRVYNRELDFFRRVPEYKPLSDLRNRLDTQAVRVVELETAGPGSGPALRELAREMERTAREMRALTVRLDTRAEAGAPKDVRRVADRLNEQAGQIVRTIDRFAVMFR